MKHIATIVLLGFCLFQVRPVHAQQRTAGDWAWTSILDHEGVAFSYIFYQRADERHNGVVLKLVNANTHAISYRFKIVFRSEGEAVVEAVSGTLKAGEIKTGDKEGLFWIPFKDGREIAEVGLRGYSVQPIRPPDSSAAAFDHH